MQITKERDVRPDWREVNDRRKYPRACRGTESPPLIALMRMSRDEWDRWTRGTALRRSGYAGFKRNVAVALGNWLASTDEPAEEARAVLRDATKDDEPLVCEHVRWALEQAQSDPLALPALQLDRGVRDPERFRQHRLDPLS